MVDLACGRGRHSLHLARGGTRVIGLDRNPDHLRELGVAASREELAVATARCDLETGDGIPLVPGRCGAILVFRFLYRPLAEAIEAALAPGGVLLFETFALPHRRTGRGPRREAFYLASEELLRLFPHLEVIAFEQGEDADDPPDITQRLCARKPAG